MGDLSKIRKILDDTRGGEHVLGASLISRGGLFVMGDTPERAHQETFAAMSAIILGAADTVSGEMKSDLSDVTLSMGDLKLMIVAAGVKYLVAVYSEHEADCTEILRSLRGNLRAEGIV
jgi:predicted regulator of Ras-like GTPase activity (Roadblock/LC7/MglB family)